MIADFIRILKRAEVAADDGNIADVLWLAHFLPSPPTREPPPADAAGPPPLSVPVADRPAGPGSPSGGPAMPPPPPVPLPAGRLYPTVQRSRPVAPTMVSAIRVPAAAALPHGLEIGRSMRPLQRRYRSQRFVMIDEEATAERIAEGGPVTPVLRPAGERWFEAALIVEESWSMVVWQQTAAEFARLLEEQGAFSDVRRWTMTVADGRTTLRGPSGVAREIGELRHPAGRRLIIVMTDGVAPHWREGWFLRHPADWAGSTPVVVAQVLPKRLWSRTALGQPAATAWTTLPGVANRRLSVHSPWWAQPSATAVPLLVFSLEPEAILLCTRALMAAPVGTPAVMIDPQSAAPRPVAAASAVLPRTAGDRVERFRAIASANAFDLAVFFSAVPLTLPVMRLVQRVMRPGSRQSDLAEVLVGGVVERVTPAGVTCEPDAIEFDFYDGVRDILQGSLLRDEAIDVLEAVSGFVERRWGQALDFGALIEDPEGQALVPEEVRPFARLGAAILHRCGLDGVEPTVREPVPGQPTVTPQQDATLTMRWLHLSDLHMGCRGEEVWWLVRSEFKDSIRQHFRTIDMILVTGDLTFSAQPEQFKLFDRFLAELLGWLREAGQETEPLVIPVPGNHDLVHLDDLEVAPFYILENFWKDPAHRSIESLRKRLWETRSAAYFDPLFGNYVDWLDKSILPRLTGRLGVSVRRSHFPGDLSVFVDLPDRPPVTVVGLNSAWIQYNKGDFDRRIELFTQQLHCALGNGAAGSPLDSLDGRLNLLLMHHPLAWLSKLAAQRFKDEIYPPDRFLLCLHGHMHESRSEAVSQSGGKFRYSFQAPSLFGLEHYGKAGESRTMGYAWGEMDAAGTVRVWPFKRGPHGGRQVFLWDPEFEPDPAGHRLRPLTEGTGTAGAPADITPWLEALLDRTGYIEVSGIGSGVGQTRDAARYPIEQLYTTLRSRDTAEELAGRSGSVTLAELMPRYPLLLIEGPPGVGKTTFLRLVATMLARDLLGILCPDAPSWREKHLGMAGRVKPPAPLFLRLSELAILLTETKDKAMPDDHNRLLDLLALTASAADNEDWRKYWEELLARGEAILLLDGLDEVADDRLRDRVFAIFRDANRHWVKSPVVVTSRPLGAEAVRKMGFHRAVIEDFGKEEIQKFIERWVAALYNLPIGVRPEGAAGQKADRIIHDVIDRPALRRLAANPVMLTCLCVVHWNEGDLPEGRLYRAVIRWLIAARSWQREAAGFTDQFAREAFAALAFAMMGGVKGATAAVVDFETGAKACLTLAKRHFSRDIGIRWVRDWLRFECLWSGIVEEPTAGKIRFWHLTFQEYLAAQELAWRRDKDGVEDWWPVVRGRLDDLQWRETVDLLPGVLFDEGGGGRVDLLLRRVIELRGDRPSLAEDARVFGLLNHILRPMAAYQYKPPPDIEQLHRNLRDRCAPVAAQMDRAAEVLDFAVFSDAPFAPEMVVLPTGEFEMGWPKDERIRQDAEEPQHRVTIGTRFAIGRYAVTFEEYDYFCEATGRAKPKDEHWGRGRRPVINVSWEDAQDYCAWLSGETGQHCRLPSEAEWEYACRAGTTTRYAFGNKITDKANYGHIVGRTTEVGAYPANPWGLYDMHGNVWEWVEDVWHESYKGAPADGAAWTDREVKTSSRNRIVRGGCWFIDPWACRSSSRIVFESKPNRQIGFRVARTFGGATPTTFLGSSE